MKKRMLALLLALVMVLGMMPGAVATEQEQTTVIYGDETAADSELALQSEGDAPDLAVNEGCVNVSTEDAFAAAIGREDVTDIYVVSDFALTAAYTVTDKDVRICSGVNLTATENGSLTMIKTASAGTGKGDFVQLVGKADDLKLTKPDFVTLAADELFYLWLEQSINVNQTIDLDSDTCIILIANAKLNLAAGVYFQSSWIYAESSYYYTYAPVYVTMADEAEESFRCYFFSSWEDAQAEMDKYLDKGWHIRYVMADLGENGALTLTKDFYCSNLILGPDTKLVVDDCHVETGNLEVTNPFRGENEDVRVGNYVEVLGSGFLKVHGRTCVEGNVYPDSTATLDLNYGDLDITGYFPCPELALYSSTTPSNETYVPYIPLTEDSGTETYYAIVDFWSEDDSRTVKDIGLGWWDWNEEGPFVNTQYEPDCVTVTYQGNGIAKVTVDREKIRQNYIDQDSIQFNLYAEVRDPADPENPEAETELHPFGYQSEVVNRLDRLMFRWVDWEEAGHFENTNEDYSAYLSMAGGESRSVVFYMKSFNADTGRFDYTPVQVTTNSETVVARALEDIRDGEINSDYFTEIIDTAEGGSWGQTVTITPTGVTTSAYLNMDITYGKAAMFSGPAMSNETYLNWFGWSASRRTLYACVDLEEGEEVVNFWVNEEDTEVASIEETDTTGVYKITLPEDLPEEFYLDVGMTVQNSNGDSEDHWAGCQIGYYHGGEQVASFEINEGNYTLDTDGVWGAWIEGDWREVDLPDGVSYDLKTNTLTLNKANLSYLGVSYENDDPNNPKCLPNANLTVNLIGESSVGNAWGWNAMDLYAGVNVTFTGSGSLILVGSLNEDGHGTGLGVENASLTLDGPTLKVVCEADMPFDQGHYNGIMLNNSNLEVKDGNLVILQKGWNGIQVGGYDYQQQQSTPGNLTISGGLVQIIFSGDSFGGSGIYVDKDSTLNITGGRLDVDSTELSCATDKNGNFYVYEDGNEAHAHISSICTYGGTVNISNAEVHLDMAKHGNGFEINPFERDGKILGGATLNISGPLAVLNDSGEYVSGTFIIVTGRENNTGLWLGSGTTSSMTGGNLYLHTPQGGSVHGQFAVSDGLISSIFPNEVESGGWNPSWGDFYVGSDWRSGDGGMTVSGDGKLQVNSLDVGDGRTLNVTGGRIDAMPHRDPDPDNPEDDGYDEGLSIRDNAAVSISGEGKLYVNMSNMTEGSWGHGVSIGNNGLLKLQGGELKVIDIMRGEAVYVERGSNLNITGGALTINSVAPAALPGPGQVDYNVAGIHVIDSYLRMQGGEIDIDFGWRGTGLHVGGEAGMDEEGNYFPGIGNVIQSGGTIDICFNHPGESSEAFADWTDEDGWGWEGFCVESGSTMTLRGGSMNVDNQCSVVLGTLNLYDGASLTVTKGDWMSYGWATLLVDYADLERLGTLNVYGGDLTVRSVDSYCALDVLSNYVQTGGTVTVDNIMSGNWTWTDEAGDKHEVQNAAFVADTFSTVTVSGGTLNINQTPITGDGHYACGLNVLDTFRLQGGTVNAYGDEIGVEIAKFILDQDTIDRVGEDFANRVMAIQPCMYLSGGKLNAAAKTSGTGFGIGVSAESEALKVTGGEHTFTGGMIGLYVTDATTNGSGAASFTGGMTTISGWRCAMVNDQYAETSGLNPDAKITWGGKVHATAAIDGVKTELTEMPFEVQHEEGAELYTYSFAFIVDGDAASEGLKEVVFGPEEGVVPELKEDVSATIQIINASSFVGTRSSIRVDAAGSGVVTIYLSEGLQLVKGSVSINGVETADETLSYLVEGGASIVFSVIPNEEGNHIIEVTTSSGEAGSEVTLTAYGFDLSAPTSTFAYRKVDNSYGYESYVSATGNTAAEQKVTLKLVKRTVNREPAVEETEFTDEYTMQETTANALGGLIKELRLPLDKTNMTYSQTFDFEVYLENDFDHVVKEIQVTWYPLSKPDPGPEPVEPDLPPEPVPPIELPEIIIKNDVHDEYNVKVKRITRLDPGIYNHFFVYWPGENYFCFEVHPLLAPGVEIEELNVELRFTNDPNEKPESWELERKEEEETNETPLIYRVCEELPGPPKYIRFTYNVKIPGIPSPVPGETPWYKVIPIIDPSGIIYEGTEDNPVEGAEVSLYFGGDDKNNIQDRELYTDITTVFGQANPQITNESGSYHWDVPEGWWQVEAVYGKGDEQKVVTSQWMWVGSPRTDVHLNLNTEESPADVTKVYVTDANGIPDDPAQEFNVTVKVANRDAEQDLQVQVAVAAYTANDQFIGLYTNPAFKTTLEKNGTMLVPIVVQPNGKVVDKLKAFIVNPDGSWTPIGVAETLSKK